METVNVKMDKREDVGKKASHALRRDGKIPAIMYAKGTEQRLSVEAKVLFKALSGKAGRSVIVGIGLEGEDERKTVLKELQYHPITDELIHADFMEIDIDKLFTAKVPIKLEGEAVGIKLNGGVLSFHKRAVSMQSLPEKMPVDITVDISKLDINDRIKLSDVELADGLTFLDDLEATIVSIAPPKRGPGGEPSDEADGEAEAGADGAKAEPEKK